MLTITPLYMGEILRRGTQNLSHIFNNMGVILCTLRKNTPLYKGVKLHRGTLNLSLMYWRDLRTLRKTTFIRMRDIVWKYTKPPSFIHVQCGQSSVHSG